MTAALKHSTFLSAADHYDTFLFDLDGVVYRGTNTVPYAVESLRRLRDRDHDYAFITNNASRTPQQVSDLLTSLGVSASATAVVTSAESAASLLSSQLSEKAPVLVIGGQALESALEQVGLNPVRSATARPVALVQGWAPEVDWHQLAEGAYALSNGVPWVVTNTDLTVPKERGLTPGNGTLVAALETTTGHRPTVVGKPHPPLLTEAVRRTQAQRALVVGDRLDTDVAAAVQAGLDSAVVLTGATTPDDLLKAPPGRRPTHLWQDLRDLEMVHTPLQQENTTAWRCGAWRADMRTARISLESVDSRRCDLDALRVLCQAVWSVNCEAHAEVAEEAVRIWHNRVSESGELCDSEGRNRQEL